MTSIGGDEAYAKIAEGLRKKDVRFIPLFFMPKQEIESVIIPSIYGVDFSKDCMHANPHFFMCFSGIGSLRISDEISNEFGEIKESKFTAGNVIFVPANEKHQSKNNSEKTVKFLCLTPVHK